MKVDEESLCFVIFQQKIDNVCPGYLDIYLFKIWGGGWDSWSQVPFWLTDLSWA